MEREYNAKRAVDIFKLDWRFNNSVAVAEKKPEPDYAKIDERLSKLTTELFDFAWEVVDSLEDSICKRFLMDTVYRTQGRCRLRALGVDPSGMSAEEVADKYHAMTRAAAGKLFLSKY